MMELSGKQIHGIYTLIYCKELFKANSKFEMEVEIAWLRRLIAQREYSTDDRRFLNHYRDLYYTLNTKKK